MTVASGAAIQNMNILLGVDETPSAGERPESYECASDQIAARHRAEKAAVLAEPGVVAEHEVMSCRNGVFPA